MNPRRISVAIIGGGTGGIAVAARLAKQMDPAKISIFEPSGSHYYQPLFTLVGGGDAKLADTVRPTASLIPHGVTWHQKRVQSIDPQRNRLVADGEEYEYEYLVVAPGLTVDFNGIAGLPEALRQDVVCTNYSESHVEGTWRQIRAFKGGTAIFTFPATPIKCGGAPQKIMYLADDHFRRVGTRQASRVIFATAGDKIFAVDKYAKALLQVIERRGIEVQFKRNLVAIDPATRTASFADMATGTTSQERFDFMHVTPPMRPHDFVAQSPLAGAGGWVDVDRATLQHTRFKNVFALGDTSNLPTSKTGAAIRMQAPTLVANLLAVMAGRTPTAHYDGYTSCPLVTGYGKLILAEFDYDLKPRESFPFDQGKERFSMYLLKKYGLPQLYWHGMMRGRA